MKKAKNLNEYATADHALMYLSRADSIPHRTEGEAVLLDFSPTMLTAAEERFAKDPKVQVVDHNLDHSLPDLGQFDVIVSSFAIHHCKHERKKQLYVDCYWKWLELALIGGNKAK